MWRIYLYRRHSIWTQSTDTWIYKMSDGIEDIKYEIKRMKLIHRIVLSYVSRTIKRYAECL